MTLGGKVRTITNVPGGMWLQDARTGDDPDDDKPEPSRNSRPCRREEKRKRELGWFGWSLLRDISRDGKKVLFEEEAEGGGPNYTVFLRDTDGSPPVRIGEGTGEAISPDNKWVITKPAKGGALSLVPTGAGEAQAVDPRRRQLWHLCVTYRTANSCWLPESRLGMGFATI